MHPERLMARRGVGQGAFAVDDECITSSGADPAHGGRVEAVLALEHSDALALLRSHLLVEHEVDGSAQRRVKTKDRPRAIEHETRAV